MNTMVDSGIAHEFAVNGARNLATPQLHAALDRFFASINFATVKESIQPENVAKSKAAFEALIKEMDWKLVGWAFEELLQQKSGDRAFRDNGETPNWYHEFRPIIWNLHFIRTGLIDLRDLEKYWGIQADLATKLLHDGGEDFGRGETYLNAYFERKIETEPAFNYHGNADPCTKARIDEEVSYHRHLAARVAKNVDRLTRKDPQYDEEKGGLVRLKSGKLLRVPRYGGDMNGYKLQLYSDPISGMSKLGDVIEGVSTRFHPKSFYKPGNHKFSMEQNEAYFSDKWKDYGIYPYERMMAKRYPQFHGAIHTLDAMLGVTLYMMGSILHYFHKDSKDNPNLESPLGIDKYMELAKNFNGLPRAFRPDWIMVEPLIDIAKNDLRKAAYFKAAGIKNKGMRQKYQSFYRLPALLENAFFPALTPLLGEDLQGSLLRHGDHMDYIKSLTPEPVR